MELDENTLLKIYRPDIIPIGEGKGALGNLYKAYHYGLQKYVVLKCLKNSNRKEENKRKEVDILKNVNHQFLPQVYNYFTITKPLKYKEKVLLEAGSYTEMDFIFGESLHDLQKKRKVFSQQEIVQYSLQLLSALSYLHSQTPPIIHCDIKPGNIMLRPNGDICLIDFNISFFLTKNPNCIGMGSYGYAAPEISENINSRQNLNDLLMYNPNIINERIDIFGVGATLYSLAVGKSVKKGFDYGALVQKMGEPYALIIKKALSRNPNERYFSALEMQQAIFNLSRNDNEYLALVKKQNLLRGFYTVGCILSIGLIAFSFIGLKQERLDSYYKVVDEQVSYRNNSDYENEEKSYEKAIEINDSNLQAYYQNAYTLHEKGSYADCISFIQNSILNNEKVDLNQDNIERVYYLLADSYYQVKDYNHSIKMYETLFTMENLDPVFYRDYAVVLAKNNNLSQAKEIVQQAINRGLEEDSINYANGEIALVENNNEAVSYLRKVIDTTNQDDLKQRAYISLCDYYKNNNDLGNAKSVLEEAVNTVGSGHQILIRETLIQIYIDLANQYGDASYRLKAIDLLKKDISENCDTYQTYNTLSILQEKTNQYNEAINTLNEMAEKYGSDYNYYKRLAYISLDIEELKDISQRDYSEFKEYYQQAYSLYTGSDDSEMDILTQNYNQLIGKGW